MRLYCFNNSYIEGIAGGVQAAHAVAELIRKYSNDEAKSQIVTEWADVHKTIIVLRAGDHDALTSLTGVLKTGPHAWASFTEPGLNDATTSVCVVLPPKIYEHKLEADPAPLNAFDFLIVELLSKYQLAR